jgi:hypothetical protein
MTTNTLITATIVTIALLSLIGLIGYRWRTMPKRSAELATTRATVPVTPPAGPEIDVATQRLVAVIQNLDRNEAMRIHDLKVFLFWLPFIWGVIWGIVWLIYLAVR